MINSRPTPNYFADCVSKHIPPELQPAARQALADKQFSPLILEAAMKQVEETAVMAAKAAAAGNVQAIAELNKSVVSLEKRLNDKHADVLTPQTLRGELSGIGAVVEASRDEMRRLEDKVDTLAPYQLWKVYVIAGLALLVGAITSWHVRPIYKQWQWEQQQREGR